MIGKHILSATVAVEYLRVNQTKRSSTNLLISSLFDGFFCFFSEWLIWSSAQVFSFCFENISSQLCFFCRSTVVEATNRFIVLQIPTRVPHRSQWINEGSLDTLAKKMIEYSFYFLKIEIELVSSHSQEFVLFQATEVCLDIGSPRHRNASDAALESTQPCCERIRLWTSDYGESHGELRSQS